MQRYIYPAIFFKEDNDVKVLFPDLELITDGLFIEEAFLFAKAALKGYFVQVQKYDFDYNLPSSFEKVKASSRKDDVVMLVDAFVTKKDLK